ncbi:hypothetical protein G6O67_003772 [Ophiocordyceps sinensis]|uniref:Uncharacterized protein n=1 Tax=Ophiocordyceps sinensis TaxID=72228 RepID=A0A8H4PSM9_9HYPO|nr:hypothetical protein G6O67_003772 [Ophiocordyceps sinensis]
MPARKCQPMSLPLFQKSRHGGTGSVNFADKFTPHRDKRADQHCRNVLAQGLSQRGAEHHCRNAEQNTTAATRSRTPLPHGADQPGGDKAPRHASVRLGRASTEAEFINLTPAGMAEPWDLGTAPLAGHGPTPHGRGVLGMVV